MKTHAALPGRGVCRRPPARAAFFCEALRGLPVWPPVFFFRARRMLSAPFAPFFRGLGGPPVRTAFFSGILWKSPARPVPFFRGLLKSPARAVFLVRALRRLRTLYLRHDPPGRCARRKTQRRRGRNSRPAALCPYLYYPDSDHACCRTMMRGIPVIQRNRKGKGDPSRGVCRFRRLYSIRECRTFTVGKE